MEMNNNLKKLERLEQLEQRVKSEQWIFEKDQMLWAGADVLVMSPDQLARQEKIKTEMRSAQELNDSGYITVISAHARAISALLYELKGIFQPHIDYLSKYEFYGRLGVAANRKTETGNLKLILGEMMEEAIEMFYELTGKAYFAYGSNIDKDQMASRCPHARMAGKVALIGYRFLINSRGVATVIPCEGHSVEGILWWVLPKDEKNLDRYEGVNLGMYRKERIGNIVHIGRSLEALVYLASDEIPGSPRPGYLDNIISWANKHEFDQDYIAELELIESQS